MVVESELHRLLAERTAALSAAAIENGGSIDDEQLAAIGKLEQLARVAGSARPRAQRNRLPAAAALVASLAILSALLFLRTGTTEIELDVWATQLNFRLLEPQILTQPTRLEALSVLQLARIAPPTVFARAYRSSGAAEAESIDLRLTPTSEHSAITLNELDLASGTALEIQPLAADRRYRLTIEGGTPSFSASMNGPIQFSVEDMVEDADLRVPKQVKMSGGDEPVHIDITLWDQDKSVFSPQIEVEELSLVQLDKFFGQERTLVRELSTVRKGQLFFESLKGEKSDLRPGENLRFATSTGTLRRLTLEGDEVHLQFHGTVSGMTTGTGDGRRSLMPSYLEWLKAQHGLSMLWGSGLYLFGLAGSLMRWWKAAP